MSEPCDAVVIGAGVLGTSIALELAKLGMSTINVDAMPGVGQGSTADSAAIVRLYAGSRDLVAMSAEALSLWLTWGEYVEARADCDLARYNRTGSLLLRSPGVALDDVLRSLAEVGVSFEEWSTAELQEHLPIFDVRSFWPPKQIDDDRFFHDPTLKLSGAVYLPEGGFINDPTLAVQNLAGAAANRGCRFLFSTRVTAVLRDNGRVSGVRLEDGRSLSAPIVINAAGPHSAIVNRMARVDDDMNVRTRPLRHELHVVPSPPGFDYSTNGLQVSDGDLGLNFRPETGNQILVGSEDPPGDPRIWVDNPDDFNRKPMQSQWERQVYRLARRIPSLRIPVAAKGLAGLYDASDDSLPIYDRSSLDGFYMAVGTSGSQFKLAPVVGRMMASLVAACESGHDHDADPVQVTSLNADRTFDLGAFSRLRTVTARAVTLI